jgi:malate/lactate dehydrogenase
LVNDIHKALMGIFLKDLFNTNASIVRDLAKAAADAAPDANLLVISNPVSSTAALLISDTNQCLSR